MTETNQSTNQSTTTTEGGVKVVDPKVKVALGLGIEIGVDAEKAARALYNLLKTE